MFKYQKDKFGLNYVVLDHFGSKHLQSKHLSYLIKEKKIIFWTKRKINKKNYSLISHINLNIGITKSDKRKKNTMLFKKKFMLGDTDSFITTN